MRPGSNSGMPLTRKKSLDKSVCLLEAQFFDLKKMGMVITVLRLFVQNILYNRKIVPLSLFSSVQ